jgi:haloalkane dehalogenase
LSQIERTTVGPTTYAWRKAGSGPPLLLVHGFPLSGLTWRKVLPELSQHFTCYLPDLPGLGETQWSEQTDFTWHGQARALMAWANAVGLERFHLMGHDTGGTFARCLALNNPGRVRSLAIINSEIPEHRPPWIQLYQRLMYVPGTLAGFSLLLRSRTFLRSGMGFGGCFNDLALIDGEFHELFIAPLLRDRARLRGLQRYLRPLAWDVVDAFGQAHASLPMPVQLIWGADDPTFPVSHARRMLAQFQRAQLLEVPGAKLLVHEEKPDQVAAAARQFFATN